MKTVINAAATGAAATGVVTTAVECADYQDAFFLALADEYYVLRREDVGWIFRSVNNSKFGHSDSHATQRAAIESAFSSVQTTKIFQFDNFVELAQYVTTHTKP